MQRLAQLAAHRAWKQALLVVGVFGVLAARVPHLWLSGEFVAEDGWSFFATAWNHSFPGSLVIPSGGYLQVLPRLLAELWSFLPLVRQPYAYALGGLALNAVLLAVFYLPAFRVTLPSDLARLGVVALAAIAPNASNLGLPLGLHWYLAFVLTLWLLTAAPATLPGRVGFALFAVLGATSAPSTFVLAPIVLWLWWRERRPAGHFRHAALLLALALAAGLAFAARSLEPGKLGAFHPAELAAALPPLFFRGWIATALLGPPLAGWLAGHLPFVADLFGAGVLGLAIHWAWSRRAQSAGRTAGILLTSAVLMLLLSLARTAYVSRLAVSTLPEHDRYLTAPTLLFYVCLAVIIAHSAGAARRWLLACGAVTVILVALALPSARHWSRPAGQFRLRDAVPAIEAMVAQYKRDHRPASLYIPADIPYWGPVLEVGGGRTVPPEAGLGAALDAKPVGHEEYESWLGHFTVLDTAGGMLHEKMGRLRFTGLEQGRAFFRDPGDRLLFTSPLLYPRWWALQDNQWTLITPAPASPRR